MGMAAREKDWGRVRRAVLDRDGWRCRECGRAARLEVHHKRPLKDGGSNALDNLATLCVRCHKIAHKRPVSRERAELDALVAELR